MTSESLSDLRRAFYGGGTDSELATLQQFYDGGYTFQDVLDAATAAHNGTYALPRTGTDATVFVSRLGVDSATGLDQGRPVKTLAAARTKLAALAPNNGRLVLLTPGDYDLNDGGTVTANSGIDFDFPVVIEGPRLTERRTGSSYNARIVCSSPIRPTHLIRLNVNGTTNQYGYEFRDLYFEMSHCLDSAIYAESTGMALLENLVPYWGNVIAGELAQRWAFWSKVGGHGDDASWWRVLNCNPYRGPLAKFESNGAQGGNNRHFISGCTVWEGRDNDDTPHVVFVDAVNPVLIGNNLGERVNVGISATNTTGLKGFGNQSEWVATALYDLINSYDSYIVDTGAGFGTYGLLARINGGGDHTIHAGRAGLVSEINTQGNRIYGQSGATQSGPKRPGSFFTIKNQTGAGTAAERNYGPEQTHDQTEAIWSGGGFSSSTYWDGAAWSAWAITSKNLVVNNSLNIVTADFTHRRFRLRTPTLNNSAGELVCRWKTNPGTFTGTNSEGTADAIIKVRYLDGAAALLSEEEHRIAAADVSTSRGFQATTRLGASFVEVEYDLPLAVAETWDLWWLHLWIPTSSTGAVKRILRSVADPGGDGVIGRTGDFCWSGDGRLFAKSFGTDDASGWREFGRADRSISWTAIQTLQLGAQFVKEVAPAAPAANNGILFLQDNGSGKMQLAARFPTGVVQIIATEP